MLARIGVIVASLVVLAGCGSGGKKDSPSTPDPNATPVVISDDAVGYGGSKAVLKCNKAYTPVEIGVGRHTEADAEYSLTEVRGPRNTYPDQYPDVQNAVKLFAKPVAGTEIPEAIVRTADSPDKSVSIRVGRGGTVDGMEFKTSVYSRDSFSYHQYPIGSIILCTKRPG